MKSTTFCNNQVDLILNAVAIADLAQNDGSSPLTSLWLAAYTGTLTNTADPTVNEATFGGYARKITTRGGNVDWTAAAAGISQNVNELAFPACVSGSNLITHVKLVTTASGAGVVLWAGNLAADRTVIVDIILRFIPGALKVKES